ncbi:hypothetical protein GCM10022393_42700 [Aquimarina addita]|uniref:DUF2283 domain-containing protein n=1 Tax=Aquimarina addita TaxID=870485 RepID=A0ABP6UXZ6_9FLAO
MKVTEVMYANLAAKQYTYKFNQTYNTKVKIFLETKEGTPFVTIDFNDTPINLVFKFGYELGEIQERLTSESELMLPIDQYPLPPKEST